MSLRDQLMAKGLVSKKRAKHIDRELRSKRKGSQGSRNKKRAAERERQTAEKAAQEAQVEQRLRERKAREQEREQHETQVRLRQIAMSNRIRNRGRFGFHHRQLDGDGVLRMFVSEQVAWKLRCGEAAIVGVRTLSVPEYVVVSASAARRLDALDPSVVLFLTTDVSGLDAPDLAIREHVYDPTLGPRRATADDVKRFGG